MPRASSRPLTTYQLWLTLGGSPLRPVPKPPDLPLGTTLAAVRSWLRHHAQGNPWRLDLRQGRTTVRSWNRRRLPTQRPLPDDWRIQLADHLAALLPNPDADLPRSNRPPFGWLTRAARRPNRFTPRAEPGTPKALPAINNPPSATSY